MKISRLAILAAFLLAGSAPVAATDQNINITANVWGFCMIDGSFTPADYNLNWDSLITNGDISPTPSVLPSFSVVCNRQSSVELRSLNGGLTGPAFAAGFENVINYTASTTGFVAALSGSTSGGPGPEVLDSANRATPGAEPITVTVTPIANTNPLVSGFYQDTLVLRIEPLP